VTELDDDSPRQRLARWTSTDAAIGSAAEAEQLRAQLAERVAEVADLRARLAHLTSRVAQLEVVNTELRRTTSRVSPLALARRIVNKVCRRTRSAVAGRLRR
jgi:hypothetical protein